MSKDFKSEILEEIKEISGHNKNWRKCMFRVRHSNNPITLDIRYRYGDKMGSGISLTDEECFVVADELLKLGYCSPSAIRDAVKSLDSEELTIPDCVELYGVDQGVF